MEDLRNTFRSLVRRESNPWLDEQPAWLGDLAGVVTTSTAGMYNARLISGKVIQVYNQARVPPDYDMPVRIGRRKETPSIWQIIDARQAWILPASGNRVEYHHEQHEFGGPDTVWVNRKQIAYLTAMVSDAANFIVQVYGGLIRTGNTTVLVENQLFDLSTYAISAGAAFINIEANESGDLEANVGTNFGAPDAASPTYIPIPNEGNCLIVSVLLYEGLTELTDDLIFVPLPVERGGVGAQIFSATAKSSLDDDDQFGIWDSVTGRFRSVLWSLIKTTLSSIFATISHTHEEYANDVGHMHGLVRWNAGTGQSTFEFPDYVETIESVSVAGAILDPAAYSLSSDRSQLVLDSALGSDGIVSSQYIIAGV